MRTTRQFSITLPNEMADMLRAKVEAGEYASESEVVRDGLRALAARDRAVEAWLRETVVPAAQALKADPSQALTPEQVREHLARRRKATLKAEA
ncbi:type II toxin-antitoxin system ParD family antitoxin [Burkholderia sp. Bp8963]|uniref:type II toxin-antitoxin system ParD family antitoxin n=1 Tax=Burkholderia sp. Bp8963 TaxID=2184547 RepID=UPI000F5AAC08|nr:type II toxin-antitoxin system ParD family antitoxin [Burkholderia sp. Bp8963]RQS59085.1 type II toxin-antitoxin system ParD family antitoxin [Burkholderia sp. Bp8963]